MKVSKDILEAYNGQYSDAMTYARSLGGKYKAQNIKDLAKNIEFNNVLEVGCGEGSVLQWLSDWNFSKDLNGIEISESAAEMARKRKMKNVKSIKLYDGYIMPFEDNAFDLAYCSHVIEHVEYERTLLREIQRVSKYQIIEVPIDFSFYVDRKFDHFMNYGHINIYTPALFRFLLRTEGFEIKNDLHTFFSNEIIEHFHRDDFKGRLKLRAKRLLFNLIPYLKGIKPNAYVVLTAKAKDRATILNQE